VLLIHDLDVFTHGSQEQVDAYMHQLLTGGFRALAELRSAGWIKAIGAGLNDADKSSIDERDRLITLKASRNAYGVLTAGTMLLLLRIAVVEWVQRSGRHVPDPQSMFELLSAGPLAPMHIAQLLLLALTLAATTMYASRIFFYRRGY